jgi:addiction module HigA family antidote
MRIKTHPGAILREELETIGLSANRLAMALGVAANRINLICKGERAVTPETAIRLAEFFGGEPEFWLNLQAQHDLSKLEAERGKEIRSEVRKIKQSA